ncbi:MAG: fatty acid transporter, partial [Mariprofundaceae bacterium]|nr:fatty acid transporter [Mariprofundaceae bacterium]
MKRFFWVVMMLAGIVSIPEARAAALATLDQSVSAAGVANAFVATADDPSAIHYNPAGIAWQPGIGVMFNGTLRFEDQSVQLSPGLGTPFNTASPTNLGSIYAAWMPRDGNWGMGFGFDLPFSANTSWGTAFGG